MIIQQVLKTYKDDFPLIAQINDRILLPPGYHIWDLNKNLILELAAISNMPKFCYITRHTNDRVPESVLPLFIDNFRDFANVCRKRFGNEMIFRIPIVWYVAFCELPEEVDSIEKAIRDLGIRYFPKDAPTISASIDTIQPDGNYTINQYEASNFPKYLYQVTQISIDLLRNPSSLALLREVANLEGMTYPDEETRDSDIQRLRQHLLANSQYYQREIESNDSECNTFWQNFKIVRLPYSWPHFLFNPCDVQNLPK